jgi:hypothetical protein
MARIEAQVTTGPVVVIPTPTDQGVTVAWTICRDANGLPVAGALIEVAAWGPIQPGHGSFASQSVVATSNGTGMARVDIPREANLKFRVRRGKVVSGVQQWGNWSEFVGVDADRLELPLTIG